MVGGERYSRRACTTLPWQLRAEHVLAGSTASPPACIIAFACTPFVAVIIHGIHACHADSGYGVCRLQSACLIASLNWRTCCLRAPQSPSPALLHCG